MDLADMLKHRDTIEKIIEIVQQEAQQSQTFATKTWYLGTSLILVLLVSTFQAFNVFEAIYDYSPSWNRDLLYQPIDILIIPLVLGCSVVLYRYLLKRIMRVRITALHEASSVESYVVPLLSAEYVYFKGMKSATVLQTLGLDDVWLKEVLLELQKNDILEARSSEIVFGRLLLRKLKTCTAEAVAREEEELTAYAETCSTSWLKKDVAHYVRGFERAPYMPP